MSAPYYDRHGVTVHAGDCLAVLATLPDASVDAVVTDPPYSLSFMGRDWDRHDSPTEFQTWCQQWATECLRVLKPGGHLAAFGATRTAHRLASGIEDAGFEIRDSLVWLFGGGIPKGADVSKSIDKTRDDTSEAAAVGAWLRTQRLRAGLSHAQVCAHGGWHGTVNHGGASVNWEKGHNVPTWEQWLQLQQLLGFNDDMDAEVWRLNGRKGTPGEAWGKREVIGQGFRVRRASSVQIAGLSDGTFDITAPATEASRTWHGWNTALRPAHEPIVLARKPLRGTVVATVLAHGTGAINVGATRIPGNGSDGRWPANALVVHTPACSEQVCEPGCSVDELATQNSEAPRTIPTFRWEAKAPPAERPQVDGISHPTVKPLAVMRWLVRLLTPPGGLVLDPFAGSGTTLHAARAEGFRAIGIEREPTYLPLIKARLDARPRAASGTQTATDNEPMDLLDLLTEDGAA